MRFSPLVERIAGRGVAAWDIHYAAFESQRDGADVIILSIGDPDFATPEFISQAAINALQQGDTHYADVAGRPRLRQAIAARYRAKTGRSIEAQHIITVAGAQNALFMASMCLLQPGDEVVVLDPMYVTYEATLQASGARVVRATCLADDGFRIRESVLKAAITDRTRAIFLSNPNNPTGVVLDREQLQVIADLAIAHDLWVVVDEVYESLCFERQHLSLASFPGMETRCVTIGSLSKSHAMTGWRVGWVIGPNELAGHLSHLALCMLYGIPGFIQDAAEVALRNELPQVAHMREVYRDRRDRVCAVLQDCPGARALKPAGGMFVMVDIRETGLSAQAFADRLLDEHGVSVLAGEAFGPSAAGHIRLGLVLEAPLLEDACRRIAACAGGLVGRQRL